MAAKRISDIAKELGIASKLIIQKCVDEGVPADKVKSHASVVSAGLEASIREWFGVSAAPPAPETRARSDREYRHRPIPASAWPRIEREYAAGKIVLGTVTRLVAYGAMIELESGVTGYLDISELSWTRRITDPGQMLTEGERTRLAVVGTDRDRGLISLSLRRLTEDPWEDEIPRLYRVGLTVRAVVTEITDLGVYVELEPEVEGFISNTELTDQLLNHPRGMLRVGQEVIAEIIYVDSHARTIELSLDRVRKRSSIAEVSTPSLTDARLDAIKRVLEAILAPQQIVLKALRAPGERLIALSEHLPCKRQKPLILSAPDVPEIVVRIRSSIDGGICIHGKDGWSTPLHVNVTKSVLERMRSGNAHRSDVEQVGSDLFNKLAQHGDFGERFHHLLDRATTSRPLRIVLEFERNSDDPSRCDAGDYHWETLYDRFSGRFLGIAEDVRLIRRFADFPQLRVDDGPHGRLSVGMSCPRVASDGTPLQTLAQVNELEAFKELASLGKDLGMPIDSTYRVGLDNLRETLASAVIFHYSGHGRAGLLELQHPDGRGERLTSETLMQALAKPVPKIVVLNCCRGAMQGDQPAATAKAFLSRAVPCVVGVTGDLLDTSAIHFVKVLYKSLLSGDDLETSLQRARWYMFGKDLTDWFLPSLWSQADAPVTLAHSPAHEQSRSASASKIAHEVYRLRPRVVVLQKIHAHPLTSRLSDQQQTELASRLAQRVETGNHANVEHAVSEFLADTGEVKSVIDSLPPSNEIAGPVSRAVAAIELDVVPRIRDLAASIPELIRAVVARPTPPPATEQFTREWPSPSAVFEQTRPLSLPLQNGQPMPLELFIERVKGDLILPTPVVEQCVVSLLAGQHLLLIGPPGTGKSTIASNLAAAFGYKADVATANPDWTTLDVVGGLFPRTVRDQQGSVQLSYEIRPGHMTQALLDNWQRESNAEHWVRRNGAGSGNNGHKGAWLIIDELNRAPMDQAFGELFTALVAHELRVPQLGHDGYTATNLRIPHDFRLIGTANTADKHLLFGLSEALKRRFAFVEIPPHFDGGSAEKLVDQILKRPAVNATSDAQMRTLLVVAAQDVLRVFQRIQALYPIGPARILDILAFAAVLTRVKRQNVIPDEGLGQALSDQVFPLLENADPRTLGMMSALLDGAIVDHCRQQLQAAVDSPDGMPSELRNALTNLGKYFAAGAPGVPGEAQTWGRQIVDAMRGGRNGWEGLTRAGWINEPLPKLPIADNLAQRLRGVVSDG